MHQLNALIVKEYFREHDFFQHEMYVFPCIFRTFSRNILNSKSARLLRVFVYRIVDGLRSITDKAPWHRYYYCANRNTSYTIPAPASGIQYYSFGGSNL